MTSSPEQNGDGDELDEAFVVGQELVVSDGDAVELLQLAGEALDEVALLVESPVVRPLALIGSILPGQLALLRRRGRPVAGDPHRIPCR